MGDFQSCIFLLDPVLRRGALRDLGLFSHALFPSELDYELVSLRPACYRLICRFRSPRIPLAISVKDHVLKIVGLEQESGLILSDFFFRICWRQSKKQPSDLAIFQYTVNEWLRRPGGCLQPK